MSTLSEQPFEILIEVFAFLPLDAIPNVACACHEFASALRHPAFWQLFAERKWPAEKFDWPHSPRVDPKVHFRNKHALMKAAANGLLVIKPVEVSSPADMMMSRRYKHCAVTLDDHRIMFMNGQINNFTRFSDMALFDVRYDSFVPLTASHAKGNAQLPPAFSRNTAVVYKDKVVSYGGFDGLETYYQVQTFDLKTRQWERHVCTQGPTPPYRTNHQSVVLGNEMYTFGGLTGENLDDLNDLWALNLDTMTWRDTKATGDVPPARCGHSMWVSNNKIFLFGGGAEVGWQRMFSDIHVYDPATNQWALQPCTGEIQPLIFPLYTAVDEKKGDKEDCAFVFFFGGIGVGEPETLQKNLYVFDQVSSHWSRLTWTSNEVPVVTTGATGAGGEDEEVTEAVEMSGGTKAKTMGTVNYLPSTHSLYFFGGSDSRGMSLNDFEVLTLPW